MHNRQRVRPAGAEPEREGHHEARCVRIAVDILLPRSSSRASQRPRIRIRHALAAITARAVPDHFSRLRGSPSGYPELLQLYSKQPRRINASLFNLPEYDRAAKQVLPSATAAEQIAAARRMSELARTFMPMLPAIFRLEDDFVQRWLRGFSAPVFSTYWK